MSTTIRTTTTRRALLLALCCLLAGPALGDQAPVPDGVSEGAPRAVLEAVLEDDGLRAVVVRLPGAPRDLAPLPAALGGGLAVLTDAVNERAAGESPTASDRSTPAALWRVTADGTATRLAEALPERAETLLAAPSIDRLWLAAEGALYALRAAPQPTDGGSPPHTATATATATATLLIESSDLVPAALTASQAALDARAGAPPTLAIPGVGTLRLVALDDTEARTVASLPLPVDARRSRHGLLLSSPTVTALGDGTWIAGPEPIGRDRLRLHRLRVAPDGTPSSEVFWARLPGAETLRAGSLLRVDGEPAVVALTTGSDGIDLFETLALRVFPLRADRTGNGTGPILQAATETRRWYLPEVAADDLDGDGKDDLVVIQPLGLGAGELRVEVFRGRGGVAFDGRPRRVDLDLPSAAWSWGHDLDGDGVPDLAAVAEGRLSLHRGEADDRRPVGRRPWRQLDRPALRPGDDPVVEQERDVDGGEPPPVRFSGRPRVFDLDGDGKPELVLLAAGEACGREVCGVTADRSSLLVAVTIEAP